MFFVSLYLNRTEKNYFLIIDDYNTLVNTGIGQIAL